VFRIVTTQDELLKVFCVRSVVFLEEQACPYVLEFDGLDYGALHILGEEEGEPCAAGRIRFLGAYAKFERIAIRRAYRGGGRGHQLVDFMLRTAREHGFTQYKMHAQAHLVDFYRQHGFEPRGELFQEAGIDHFLMVRHDSVMGKQ
jgi:predicted GNAT family N-acyltransferase